MDDELSGVENILEVLTGNSREPNKRGRPFSLDQPSLLNRRRTLQFWIDGSWGKIGWKLRTAKTVSDIRKAFKPLGADSNHPANLFAQNTRKTATAAKIRLRSKQLGRLNGIMRRESLATRQSQEAVDRVRAAFQQAESKRDKGEFEEILNERVSLQEEAQRKYAALERKERKLTEQLREERAFFAQHELLRCLKSGRCAFTPYKLASAMAGLPEVGWRRSAKRCSRDKSSSEAGQIFWLFRLLCRAISESKAANTNLSEHVRRTLQTHKDRKDYRLINAKENWRHLRRAIEGATRSKKQHPGSLPYRIIGQYQEYIQRKSAVELFREAEEKLE